MQLLRFTLLLISFITISSLGFGQTYFLNGSAEAIGGDCYRLTTTIPTQNGTVWYADQLDLNQPFNLQFIMNFGNIDANGADGICFVLQTVGTGAIGQSGGGMGYLNFGTSLGIEFDTWQNVDYADPFQDHLAIEINGDINHNGAGNVAGPVSIDPFNANVEDGEDHVVQIIWEPTSQTIQVYFDCVFRLEGSIDLINEVFQGNSLVYWGFTAATGGSFNNQTVCLTENILSVGNEVFICSGSSALLSAGNSLDGNYLWSPPDFLDDPASATPTTTSPENITYTVEFTDLCGNVQSSEINVIVDELTVNVGSIDPLTCNFPSDIVTASVNLNLPVTYSWTLNGSSNIGNSNGNYTLDELGVYTVTANYQNQCIAQQSFEVIGDFATLNANAGPDQQITCVETVITLQAGAPGGSASYNWSIGNNPISSSQQTNVTQPGTYTLIVINQSNGCASSDQVVVSLNNTPPALFIPNQDTLNCAIRSLNIEDFTSSANNITIEWSTVGGTIVEAGNTTSPLIAGPGYYTAAVIDNTNGCESEESTFIYADEYFYINLDYLTLPNIITDNGDQFNSLWKPFLSYDKTLAILPLFSNYEFIVFNRWGKELDRIENAKAWVPNDLEPGVYYYIFNYEITCGQTKKESVEGIIHIME